MIQEIRWTRHIGPLSFQFLWRSRKSFLGRFGGGWNWELGFQYGGDTLIVNWLICSTRFTWEPKKESK